ncbi:hypothetical protein HRG_003961 [Hirsutella rhossiliensis]|uniref:Uncharacterized protein n=1 Tax=Hirsutella rhossiliensis TaxID=111463 RepID=A0A9P8SLL7_9HYPO|nr:uncharacterized protein HRG_03961 [Hirsutella rhossiliensis]KAH0965945.1 hypothetical protein HRG_03961 [Hirsutella rhossiliensis]
MRFTSMAVMAGSALAFDAAYPPPNNYAAPAGAMTSVAANPQPESPSTVYSTKVHTIISCGPEVVNCPAHSTVVSTEMLPANTAVSPGAAGPGQPAYPQPAPQASQPAAYLQPAPEASQPAPEAPQQPAPESPGQSAYPQPAPEASQPTGYPQPAPEASRPAGGLPNPVPGAAMPTGAGSGAVPTAGAVCPASSVTAITKTYTTVLTSVEYSTIQTEGPCAAATQVPQVPQGPNGPQAPQGPNGPQGPVGTGVPVAPPAAYPPSANTPPMGNST